MSIICGVFALKRSVHIPPEWTRSLRAQISRDGLGAISEYSREGVYLLHVNLGALPGAAWSGALEDNPTAISGDPVLPGRPADSNRDYDLAVLRGAGRRDLSSLLRRARGQFNLAMYSRAEHELVLATDRLGGRRIFKKIHPEFLIFAGVNSLIYPLPNLGLAADFTGMMESVAFDVPLGERTEYHGVNSLQGGKFLTCTQAGIETGRYWDWCADAGPPERETVELRRELYMEFKRAIELRLGGNRSAFAALSGGLDSRCVATVLNELGVRTHTLNASWLGSLDRHLAKVYARRIGSTHHEQVLADDEAGSAVFRRCFAMCAENSAAVRSAGGNPSQIWGGNDGSISVGYLYIHAPGVAALRAGEFAECARLYLGDAGIAVSPRGIRRRFRDRAVSLPLDSVLEQLRQLNCQDPAQRLFMFLLVNRQRRMLAWQLEEIDRLPVEMVEPFFDADFLALTCRLPVDESIGHGLYYRWLREFPPVLSSVPWQAYPGHAPCPIEMPHGATPQWDIVRSRVGAHIRARIASDIDTLLSAHQELGDVLDQRMLMWMRIGNRLGLLDGTPAFRQAIGISKILQHCVGRIEEG